MKNYNELKKQHSDELNAFEGIFFAFDKQQFIDGMTKVGLKPEETNKLFKLAGGGFILKSRSKAFSDMFKRHEADRKELRKNKKELKNSLIYELKNHEFCITRDPEAALRALGLTEKDVPKEMLKSACKLALVGVNY